MMKRYSHNRTRNELHRRHSRRRLVKRLILLLAVLGGLCLGISLITAILYFGFKDRWGQMMGLFSLAYLIGGLLLLAIRQVAIWRVHRSRRRSSPRDEAGGEAGFILVIVLVLLGVLSLLVVRAQVGARAALRAEESALRQITLHGALTDAVLDALQELADDEDRLVDHPADSWARIKEFERPEGTALFLRVIDQNRFFDLNNGYLMAAELPAIPASRILMDIMTLCGDFTPVERVEALREWVSPDDTGFRGSAFYMKQDPPYRPANTWLTSWNELLWIQGFDPDYFERRPRDRLQREFEADVMDQVAILPVRRTHPIPVNVNTASREVLLGILGYEREHLVRYVLAAREDEPLRSVDHLLALADPNMLRDVRPYLDVKSEFFTVEARAYSDGTTARVRALARRAGDGTVRVLRWVY